MLRRRCRCASKVPSTHKTVCLAQGRHRVVTVKLRYCAGGLVQERPVQAVLYQPEQGRAPRTALLDAAAWTPTPRQPLAMLAHCACVYSACTAASICPCTPRRRSVSHKTRRGSLS